MNATEQYFPVVLFIKLCKVVLNFESVDGILKGDHFMKATQQYQPPQYAGMKVFKVWDWNAD